MKSTASVGSVLRAEERSANERERVRSSGIDLVHKVLDIEACDVTRVEVRRRRHSRVRLREE